MTIKQAINWLEYKPRQKDKTDLNKMKNALKILKNPEKNFKAIHITGTNGKGSVAHMISKSLSTVYTTGLFTSPYVTRFNERLQINDIEIEDNELLKYILWAKEFDQMYKEKYKEDFSFFELLTLIAIKYFSDNNVTYAVVEVGIGGRLDSTNVIDAEYAVITSIGFDHVNQLGNTLKQILTEKLGIVKKGKKLFTAVENFNEVILNYTKDKNASVTFLKNEDFEVLKSFPLEFKYQNEVYHPNLQGLYQVKNTILAIMVLKEIIRDITTIKEAIRKTENPGRFEVVNKEPYIILDGAHNYEAIDKLSISLKEIFKNKTIKVLYASMEDKPYLKMIERLRLLTKNIYLTSVDFPRALKDFSSDLFKGLKTYDNHLEGFKELKESLNKDDVLVITGSMYLVSSIRGYLINYK